MKDKWTTSKNECSSIWQRLSDVTSKISTWGTLLNIILMMMTFHIASTINYSRIKTSFNCYRITYLSWPPRWKHGTSSVELQIFTISQHKVSTSVCLLSRKCGYLVSKAIKTIQPRFIFYRSQPIIFSKTLHLGTQKYLTPSSSKNILLLSGINIADITNAFICCLS